MLFLSKISVIFRGKQIKVQFNALLVNFEVLQYFY